MGSNSEAAVNLPFRFENDRMLVKESILRDCARLVVWFPIRWSVRLLPLKTAFNLFNLIGDLHLTFRKKSLLHLSENIQRGISEIRDESLNSILRTYLRNHYLDRLHIFTYPKLRKINGLNSICEMTGMSHLEQVLLQGKGAILCLGHYGPIQLPLFHLGTMGYRVIQIGLPTATGLSWIGKHVAFRLRMKYERMIPAVIHPATDFLRPIFKHLKQNGIVMTTIDPAGGGKWIGRMVRYPFLGHLMPFPLGAATLSIKTGAPILPLRIQRIANDRYRFEICEPFQLPPSATPMEITAYLVAWYEDQVSRDPGLWHFWDEFEYGKLLDQDDDAEILSPSSG